MFYSFNASQTFIQKIVPQLEDGVRLVSSVQVSQDKYLTWGVRRVDALVRKFFSHTFPSQDVVWGIEEEKEPNACVWGHISPSVILVTSGAIAKIFASRTKFSIPATSFAKTYAFPANMGSTSDTVAQGLLLAEAGENLSLFALAALFAHEVGHIHDRQFERLPSIVRTGRLGHAHEISADTWAIRACCNVAVDYARDLSGRTAVPLELVLRASLFYAMVGYGLIDEIDWHAQWQFSSSIASGEPTHPPGALRLVSVAVSVAEWLTDCDVLSEKTAMRIALEVFGVSAQTLYWWQTGKVVPVKIFHQLTLMQFGDGAIVDTMRDEYEKFRAALPPTVQ